MRVVHLFLTGNIGAGKSSIIKKTILPYINEVGGFYTQRLFIGDKCEGFCLNPLLNSEQYEINKKVKSIEECERVFLFGRGNRWMQDTSVFEKYGVGFLNESLLNRKKLILLDEVGGIELLSTGFRDKLYEVLDSDVPSLGVLKSQTNNNKLVRYLCPGDHYDSLRLNFLDFIMNKCNVKLIELNCQNYEDVENIIGKYVEVIMKSDF